jgi:Gram-negative bacterial TonB protein C-terminal
MAKVHLSGMFALTILFGVCFPVWAQSEAQPTPSPTPAATDLRASPEDSTHLVVIKAPQPYYPMAAAKKSLQGKVWIQLLISETGDVESAEILSGDQDLAKAAQGSHEEVEVQAVHPQWKASQGKYKNAFRLCL